MVFLNLYRAYDALDSSRCLEILYGYGVGPQAFRILRTYWGRMSMVAKAGGYYGSEFQVFRRVTQGYPLYPTIFNFVVYVVVRHWVEVMVESVDDQNGRRQEGRHQNFLSYAYYGMVASSYLRFLQGGLITLAGLFDRVGLKINIGKTFVMFCHPCQAAGTQSKVAYG